MSATQPRNASGKDSLDSAARRSQPAVVLIAAVAGCVTFSLLVQLLSLQSRTVEWRRS
jgi:hypothetical protein